jgi:hypothetical protein
LKEPQPAVQLRPALSDRSSPLKRSGLLAVVPIVNEPFGTDRMPLAARPNRASVPAGPAFGWVALHSGTISERPSGPLVSALPGSPISGRKSLKVSRHIRGNSRFEETIGGD